ncbi:terminase small subunit [Serratia fonticola]|uniref:terminase small subunit n=1 Tax=Serratia fonticola TaxID=47917 RepID=UPI00192D0075|nr:terminase small subunit [Serratia fonticola]MBL5825416.1 terminase small subunit [Serratia fonticola]
MLTGQKRKFAIALMSGSTQAAAAIKAGYSEKSARSKGSQLNKDPDVIAFINSKRGEVTVTADQPQPKSEQVKESKAPAQYEDPLDFLRSVMNDTHKDIDTRKDAAKAMLPYIHPKKGEGGKKDARNAAAQALAGKSKFGSMAPPKLVVNNGKG